MHAYIKIHACIYAGAHMHIYMRYLHLCVYLYAYVYAYVRYIKMCVTAYHCGRYCRPRLLVWGMHCVRRVSRDEKERK